jgi:hypothetical protein
MAMIRVLGRRLDDSNSIVAVAFAFSPVPVVDPVHVEVLRALDSKGLGHQEELEL